MSDLLRENQRLSTPNSAEALVIGRKLGGGTQGEVYAATLSGRPVAVKWFYPQHIEQNTGLKGRLLNAISQGSPGPAFLWPQAVIQFPAIDGFGYVMPLRDSRYRGIVDLMKRRIQPSLLALTRASFALSHNYHLLHAQGLCYRDINFGNVFLDPQSGDVLICDNDNVDTNNHEQPGGVVGTPRFMAPEVVVGRTNPNAQSDLYSLAVLLFYILMVHHPLEGTLESEIHALDPAALHRLYGEDPVFIFDPEDVRNRPVPGLHDNAIACWALYPKWFQDLFVRAFTTGISDPSNGRVTENQWRKAMIELQDSIYYCVSCMDDQFYDPAALLPSGEPGKPCRSCAHRLELPPRMRLENRIIVIPHDKKLFPHHIDPGRRFDFSVPVAEVVQHPLDKSIWGLKNRTGDTWTVTLSDGAIQEVPPERSATLRSGMRMNFGMCEGEIRL